MKRRLILKGAAGAALATPFLSSLEPLARAGESTLPRRLVIFHTSNGCLTNRWFPTVENGGIDTSALDGTTLEPLGPFASKLLFPRGLCMYPYGTINGYFDPTYQSMGSKLTAAPVDPNGEHLALGRSLDHVVASLVNPGGVAPLVLSIGPAYGNALNTLSYSAASTPVSPVTDLVAVYASLTGAFTSGEPTTEAAYRVARGESIIDAVREDLTSYQRLDMSARDQLKIEAWLELLRGSEQGMLPLACSAQDAAQLGITQSALEDGSWSGAGASLATAFTLGGDMMLRLMTLAMMCDTNRSILCSWPAYVTFNWDGIVHEFDHAGLAHRTGSASVSGPCVEGVLDMLAQIDGWYAGRYAELVGLVDEIPEGDGTLLDNSAVMWLPQYADGAALNVNNLPIVIAGSASGYLKQGVSVNLEGGALGTGNSESSCTNPGDMFEFGGGSTTGHVPLNKLYVTLLNAIGATEGGEPVTSFGVVDTNDPEAGITDPGELPDLKA